MCNSVISSALRAARGFFTKGHILFSNECMDKEPNEPVAKKQIRCAISGCFDKYDICCKECDIKNCRYKCNFIDREVCEHQVF